MFDVTLQFSLAKVDLSVNLHEGTIIRRCRLALEREFDAAMAAGLGPDAKKLRALISGRAVRKATIDIAAVVATAELTGAITGEVFNLGTIWGDTATAKAPKEDDEPVSVRLAMVCHYERGIWNFLGDNCGGFVTITFQRAQTEITGARPPADDEDDLDA